VFSEGLCRFFPENVFIGEIKNAVSENPMFFIITSYIAGDTFDTLLYGLRELRPCSESCDLAYTPAFCGKKKLFIQQGIGYTFGKHGDRL